MNLHKDQNLKYLFAIFPNSIEIQYWPLSWFIIGSEGMFNRQTISEIQKINRPNVENT
jgi:hypothetical protein